MSRLLVEQMDLTIIVRRIDGRPRFRGIEAATAGFL
jgi:hypothetical protein